MGVVQCGCGPEHDARSVYRTCLLDVAGWFCIPSVRNYRSIIANLSRSRKQALEPSIKPYRARATANRWLSALCFRAAASQICHISHLCYQIFQRRV